MKPHTILFVSLFVDGASEKTLMEKDTKSK